MRNSINLPAQPIEERDKIKEYFEETKGSQVGFPSGRRVKSADVWNG